MANTAVLPTSADVTAANERIAALRARVAAGLPTMEPEQIATVQAYLRAGNGVAAALRPGLAKVDAAISDRVARGMSRSDAIKHSLCEVSKGLAVAWAQVAGVDVRRSWTQARIAIAAAGTDTPVV